MIGVLSFGQTAILGRAPAYFCEMFDTKVRVTGVSLGMRLATVIGGSPPLVAASIIHMGGSLFTLGLIEIGLCVLACIAVLLLPETRGGALVHEPATNRS